MPTTRVLWCLLVLPWLVVAQPKTYTNGIGMEFVLAPAGSFVMGKFAPTCAPVGMRDFVTESQYEECMKLAKQATLAGFKAEVPRPFYIGKFEVTQAQYRKVMGKNPSYHTEDKVGGPSDNYPVDSISWQDAQAFIRKVNELEKTTAYRLPTEVEWEYAASAGSGAEPQTGAQTREMAWYRLNSDYLTHSVGQRNPNAWDLYDMLGNVWEWVEDWYDYQIVPSGPRGPASGKEHVLKGGGFQSYQRMARVAAHAGGPGTLVSLGFRVVREAE